MVRIRFLIFTLLTASLLAGATLFGAHVKADDFDAQIRALQAQNQSNQAQADYFQCEMELNDVLLLCTNGLWHMLRDERIQQILSRGGDLQKLSRALVDEANLAGGEGNVSVVLIRVQ